ncbi:glycerol-3-phosphate acyltransferase [Geomonas sp. Red875]|uniref:Glycerol-3-phosphate acyltransferase n=1 Tax=Geomesophilobacter sediminis TaxID=2798584 RepID=A0A8J7M0X6_9BACT|nr:glycerol-3-phosphate acyltransferase [Geomesophilobacter sediminis]
MKEILFVLCAYLLGSIPTGLLLGKAFGIDIRKQGSGNIGATNVYRTAGKKLGILTLLGDCLKGLLPVLIARAAGLSEAMIAGVALAAFLGHVYTVFLGFKGGKGVATALGVFLGISPLAILLALAVFVPVLYKWRYVSLASITAAGVAPLAVAVIEQRVEPTAMALVISFIVVWRHRENIARLRAGTENAFR